MKKQKLSDDAAALIYTSVDDMRSTLACSGPASLPAAKEALTHLAWLGPDEQKTKQRMLRGFIRKHQT